jgi:hypothetical protein
MLIKIFKKYKKKLLKVISINQIIRNKKNYNNNYPNSELMIHFYKIIPMMT